MTLLLLRDQSHSEHEGKSGHREERNFKELGILQASPSRTQAIAYLEVGGLSLEAAGLDGARTGASS